MLAGSSWWPSTRPSSEVIGDVDAGRAEVGDQHVPGVGAERELARRPPAGARPGVALDDQAAVEQLGDPLRDDAARQAGVRDEVAARLRVPETDLVEDGHERVERLLGDRARARRRGGCSSGRPWPDHTRVAQVGHGTFALDTPKYDDDLRKPPRGGSRAPSEPDGAPGASTRRAPDRTTAARRRRPATCMNDGKPSRLLASPQPGTTSATSEGTHRHMDRRSDIGTAVIGSGFIGTVHIEALRRIGVNVVGLLGSSQRAGREARRADGRRARVRAPSTRCSRTTASHVVHVTSPNELHYPQVKAILAAGRHVVCEKPLAMTSEESADLVRLAAASGRVNAVNFNIRFYPLNQHVASMVRDGGVGTVRLVPAATSRTGCCSTRTGTGASSPSAAARCAPWATSAPTGSTCDVPDRPARDARDGRPATFIPVRTGPPAPSRPSRPSVRPRRSRSTSGPRTSRRSCCGSRAGRAAWWPSRSSARAARTACSTRSTAAPPPSRGIRSNRSSCGSVIATVPTSSCSGTPRS